MITGADQRLTQAERLRRSADLSSNITHPRANVGTMFSTEIECAPALSRWCTT